MNMKIPVAEQSQQSGDDQIDRDDVIQKPRYEKNQYAGDQRDERCNAEMHVQGQTPIGSSVMLARVAADRRCATERRPV